MNLTNPVRRSKMQQVWKTEEHRGWTENIKHYQNIVSTISHYTSRASSENSAKHDIILPGVLKKVPVFDLM